MILVDKELVAALVGDNESVVPANMDGTTTTFCAAITVDTSTGEILTIDPLLHRHEKTGKYAIMFPRTIDACSADGKYRFGLPDVAPKSSQ